MENDDKYLPELLAEKDSLDSSFTHAMKLLNAGKVVLWWFWSILLSCVRVRMIVVSVRFPHVDKRKFKRALRVCGPDVWISVYTTRVFKILVLIVACVWAKHVFTQMVV